MTRKIRIAQNLGDFNQSLDSYDLEEAGYILSFYHLLIDCYISTVPTDHLQIRILFLGLAEVRSLNFSKWFGSGVLHTKLWNVDDTHFYIGSANMDWRALTQVHSCDIFTSEYNNSYRTSGQRTRCCGVQLFVPWKRNKENF